MRLIQPDWPAPRSVRAFATTRRGGISLGDYADLNLADHVGDDPLAVAHNRARLARRLSLPAAPRWLRQVHGRRVAVLGPAPEPEEADAAVTQEAGVVCAVLTADCLPLLLCDRQGQRVAAVHAGWRGLLGGVIEATVAAMARAPSDLLAWLGPAIGAQAFEVGPEVRERFVAADARATAAFGPGKGDRWLADIDELARQRLSRLGVVAVSGGGVCTYSDAERFFSYRRDGRCGRMATLIWRVPCSKMQLTDANPWDKP